MLTFALQDPKPKILTGIFINHKWEGNPGLKLHLSALLLNEGFVHVSHHL